MFERHKRTFQRMGLPYREIKRRENSTLRGVARELALISRRHIHESVEVWVTGRAKNPLSGDSDARAVRQARQRPPPRCAWHPTVNGSVAGDASGRRFLSALSPWQSMTGVRRNEDDP